MGIGHNPIQFYIDQPTSWQILTKCVIIRGWAFTSSPESISAIRLRCADIILTGAVGLPRPDVKNALSEAPDGYTGFEIRGALPPGRNNLTIEARLPDGSWQELLTHTVSVRRQIIPRWAGGGSLADLIAFQMPAHMAYAPRLVQPDKFLSAKPSAPRPKFSIVTPSFNQARFLGETMRSVLEQDSVDCEYVVQDGGSTDGSQRLVAAAVDGGRWTETEDGRPGTGGRRKEAESENNPEAGPAFAPELELRQGKVQGSQTTQPSTFNLQLSTSGAPRLVAWECAPDSGQADAIAKGFAKTSGGPDDLMAWINSDDFYLPGALAYVADYFARHPDVDVIYGHRIVVDEESREIARWFLPKHDPEVLCLNDFVPQETMFWRRRLWDKVGGIDPSFKFAMDWDLLLRFQAAGARMVRVPYFLACFRVHAAQKTSAQMQSIGQLEINHLRERAQGRVIAPEELEKNSRLLRYLRRSALIELMWKFGIRMA